MLGKQASLWPVHPKPLDGEVLSSWLNRIAQGNGLTASQFRKLCLPKRPGQGADIDQIDDRGFFEALADGAGVSLDQAWQTGYASDEGRVFSGLTFNNLEWIAPPTIKGYMVRHHSLPFCPSCLAEDPVPYYRKHWRYAFNVVCPQHGLLTNHCPNCQQHYSYLVQEPGMVVHHSSGSMGICPNCNRRFQAKRSVMLSAEQHSQLTEIQNRIKTGLDSGWIDIPGQEHVHVCMYLRGLHDLAMIGMSRRHGAEVVDWISRQSGYSMPEWSNEVTAVSLESQPAVNRVSLLLVATWLAEEWPHRMTAMMTALNKTVSQVLPANTERPAWMNHPLIAELSRTQLGRSAEEVEAARQLLVRKQNWAPSKADLNRFMASGEVPLIRPLSTPNSPERNEFFSEADKRGEARHKANSLAAKERKEKPRELYPQIDIPKEQDVLVDLDDSTQTLNELAQMKRKRKSKPTSG